MIVNVDAMRLNHFGLELIFARMLMSSHVLPK